MQSEERMIRVDGAYLEADVVLAPRVVVLAHGSGSSRLSRRNLQVARALQDEGIGTVMVDLLTPVEMTRDARTAEFRYDVPMLADRVRAAIGWAHAHAPGARNGRIGLYGVGTGAAAALIAAARMHERIGGVVARGGRVDLAAGVLSRVRAPVRMIVGDADPAILAISREAAPQMTCVHDLAVVRGAGPHFAEPGAMDRVVQLACHWFDRHLSAHEPEAPVFVQKTMERMT